MHKGQFLLLYWVALNIRFTEQKIQNKNTQACRCLSHMTSHTIVNWHTLIRSINKYNLIEKIEKISQTEHFETYLGKFIQLSFRARRVRLKIIKSSSAFNFDHISRWKKKKLNCWELKLVLPIWKLNRWWKLTQFTRVIWAVYNGSESFLRKFR